MRRMRHAARLTLFIHDRDGRLETMPDSHVLHALLQQPPLITRNDDGSRTYVFDMVEPGSTLYPSFGRPEDSSLELLRLRSLALSQAARALGLPLTTALAESAELVAEAEIQAMTASQRRDG
jgi:hypothetical protein